jgi:hypothetical protein
MSLSFSSWSFDAASYLPGAVITATVNYTSTDVDSADIESALTVALSDAASGTVTQTSDTSGNFPSFDVSAPGDAPEATTVTATDNQNPAGSWTLVSNTFTGTVAPFAGVAILTGVAA